MVTYLPFADDQRPACADRLDLVDAAYLLPGADNTAAAELRRLCRHCPIAERCFVEAMAGDEHGVWAGTSPYDRTRAHRRRDAS